MEKKFKIEGMHCKSCELLLTDSIMEVHGVQKASADYKKGIVTMQCNDEKAIEQAKRAIEKEGYRVVN